MRSFVSLAALAAMALGCAPALAGDVAGFYAGIYAGGSVRNPLDSRTDGASGYFDTTGSFEHPESVVNGEGVNPALLGSFNAALDSLSYARSLLGFGLTADGQIDYLRGATFGGVVGYGFGNGVRVELDYGHSGHQAGMVHLTGGDFQEIGGSIDADGVWTWVGASNLSDVFDQDIPAEALTLGSPLRTTADFLLVNGWYDFDTGGVLTPYVGGGAGLARLSTTVVDPGCSCFAVFAGEPVAYVPAVQIGAGLKVKLVDPVSLDLGYRLKVAGASDSKISTSIADDNAFASLDLLQSGIYTQHSITAGLTFAFN